MVFYHEASFDNQYRLCVGAVRPQDHYLAIVRAQKTDPGFHVLSLIPCLKTEKKGATGYIPFNSSLSIPITTQRLQAMIDLAEPIEFQRCHKPLSVDASGSTGTAEISLNLNGEHLLFARKEANRLRVFLTCHPTPA